MNFHVNRDDLAEALAIMSVLELREQRDVHAQRGYYDDDGVLQGGLMSFFRYFWDVLEPGAELVEGWPLYAICEHLEAVTFGEINRLLMNVSPGFSKTYLTTIFWPLWEWSAAGFPNHRFLTFSYSAKLMEQANEKTMDIIRSPKFQEMYGAVFQMKKDGATHISNTRTGWKFATSVGGVSTGMRGDRVIIDDPSNVKDQESDIVREGTATWFRESASNRVNNDKSAIVVIMQRLHDRDVSGVILELGLPYCHLMIPMEYDAKRQVLPDGSPVETGIGWIDPRYNPENPESADGELAWPERFPPEQVFGFQKTLGLGYPGQYQQTPHPRGGNIFKREWWQTWEQPEFPQFEFMLASVDTAFTEDQMNDPTAMTVWGVFYEGDQPQIMLVDAWAKRLTMHGSLPIQAFHEKNVRGAPNPEYLKRCEAILPREVDQYGVAERDRVYYERIKKEWGVVEWVAHTARLRRVHRVIIENKTGGITAAQELRRIHGREGFGVDLANVKGDKVARAMAVQPLFPQGMIWAPDRQYAEDVISQMEKFPKDKHDDLTDTATMALKWLRENGFANRVEEVAAMEVDRQQLRKKAGPLYGLR